MLNSPEIDPKKQQAWSQIQQRLADKLQSPATTSAKFLLYSLTIGTAAAISVGAASAIIGAPVPPEVSALIGSVGANLVSSMIDRVAEGKHVTDDEMLATFQQAISESEISGLLTEDHFDRTIAKFVRHMDLQTNKLADLILSLKVEPKPPPFPCHRIPRPAIFAGRVHELDTLKNALNGSEPVAITALRGVGGIGKPTLAQQVAHELGDKFGLKIYTALGEKFDESRLPEILRNWSQQDFPQDAKIEQMIAITKNALTNCGCEPGVLALIDDVWTDTILLARTLKTALPDGARILITTRNIAVAGMLEIPYQRIHRLQEMPQSEGAELLLAYLPPSAADHRDKLEELSAVLGGHPLALKLAARLLLQRFTPRDLNDMLTTMRTELEEGKVKAFAGLELDQGEEKEDSVSVTLKLTLDRLGGNDAELNALRQKQFRALGALPPDFPFSAVHIIALWGGEDRKAIRELIAEGLLDDAPHPEKSPDDSEWHTQHRLLRAYARGLAREADELDSAFKRYADTVIETAEQFVTLPPENWGVLEADLPHVQVVGDTLVEMYKAIPDDADLQARASNFAFQSYPYLNYRREVRRIEWLEMGLAASRAQSEQRRELLFLNQIGLNFDGIGEKHTALKYYEQNCRLNAH